MKRSESITALAAALSKAQGEMENAIRDHVAKVTSKKGEGSSYSYNYADLASVLDAVREPMAKNGLSIAQFPALAENGYVAVTTTLMHESGEFLESDPLAMPVSAELHGPQAIGSSITYCRRYALCSILGIATETDDDGNAGSGNQAETTARPKLPPCPACQKQNTVIVGKAEFGGGLVCFKAKQGCGHKWSTPEHPAAGADNGKTPAKPEPKREEKPKPPANHEWELLKAELHKLGLQPGQTEQAEAVIKHYCPSGSINQCIQKPEMARYVLDKIDLDIQGKLTAEDILREAGVTQTA